MYIFCARPLEELEEEEEEEEEEEDGEIKFLQFHICHCSGVFFHL